MPVIRGVIGGILLFLGRELNFLFAAAMAALIGFRLTALLPPQWPGWSDFVFIGVFALIAVVITIAAAFTPQCQREARLRLNSSTAMRT